MMEIIKFEQCAIFLKLIKKKPRYLLSCWEGGIAPDAVSLQYSVEVVVTDSKLTKTMEFLLTEPQRC